MEKEHSRQQRDYFIKNRIKNTNYGGREMPKHRYNKLKEIAEEEERILKQKEDNLEFQLKAEKMRADQEKKKEQIKQQIMDLKQQQVAEE